MRLIVLRCVFRLSAQTCSFELEDWLSFFCSTRPLVRTAVRPGARGNGEADGHDDSTSQEWQTMGAVGLGVAAILLLGAPQRVFEGFLSSPVTLFVQAIRFIASVAIVVDIVLLVQPSIIGALKKHAPSLHTSLW